MKSLYNALELGSVVPFPMGSIWNSRVRPEVHFIALEATWGKALNLDQVQRSGCTLANGCYLFQSDKESIDHLLYGSCFLLFFGCLRCLPCWVKKLY